MTGRKLNFTLADEARSGDHRWWISDARKFRQDYPERGYKYDQRRIIENTVEATNARVQAT